MKKLVNGRTPAQPSSKGKKPGSDVCSETPNSLKNLAISKTPFAKWRRVKATPGSAATLALSSKKLRLNRPKNGACTPRKPKLALSNRIRVRDSENSTPVKTLPRKQKEESCAETSFRKIDMRTNSSRLKLPNGKMNGWLKKVKSRKIGLKKSVSSRVGTTESVSNCSSTITQNTTEPCELIRWHRHHTLEEKVKNTEKPKALPANEALSKCPAPLVSRPPVKPPRSFSGGSLASSTGSDSGISTTTQGTLSTASRSISTATNTENRENYVANPKLDHDSPKINDERALLVINHPISESSEHLNGLPKKSDADESNKSTNEKSIDQSRCSDRDSKVPTRQGISCGPCWVLAFAKKLFVCITVE